jgi:hypothetical protein
MIFLDNIALEFFLLFLIIVFGIIILIRPNIGAWGIVFYIIFTTTLPQSQDITFIEILQSIILLLLYISMLVKEVLTKGSQNAYDFNIVKLNLLFVLVMTILAINSIILNEIAPISFLRDLFSILQGYFIFNIIAATLNKWENAKQLFLFIVFLLSVKVVYWCLLVLPVDLIKENIILFLKPSSLELVIIVSAIFLYLIERKKHKFLLISFLLLVCLSVLLQTGRTIWVGIFCTFLILLRISSDEKVKFFYLIFIICVWALAFVGMEKVLAGEQYSLWATRIESLSDLPQDHSLQNRFAEQAQALQLLYDSHFLGGGFGHVYYFVRPWELKSFIFQRGTNYTHNDLIFLISKGGLPTLVLFLYVFSLVIKRARNIFEIENLDYWIIILCKVVFVMSIIFIILGLSTPMLQSRAVTPFIGLFWGLIYSRAINRQVL